MDKKVEFKRECIITRVAKSVYLNADTIVHIGPCVVTGWTYGSSGGDRYCRIYDGQNTNGELKWDLYTDDKVTITKNLTYPVDFDKGIYVNVESDNCHLTIEFIAESWKSYW